jgi:hypothetical protein
MAESSSLRQFGESGSTGRAELIPRSWWIGGLSGLLVVTLLPVMGRWIRAEGGDRCAADGVRVDPVFAVRIVDRSGQSRRFCCIGCAEHWLESQGASVRAIFVTGENTGEQIDANSAYFVRSSVVTNPLTKERRHVFATARDAQRHADAARGRILAGTERPLQRP